MTTPPNSVDRPVARMRQVRWADLHPLPAAARSTVLYRFYDVDGRLLYVGITNDFDRRHADHRRSQSWWPEVVDAKTTISPGYPRRCDAEKAERDAIRLEQPLHNVMHNGKRGSAPITYTFRRWLRDQRGRQDWLGDFAKDAPSWPGWKTLSNDLQAYAETIDPCQIEFLDALHNAWGIWVLGEHEPVIPEHLPIAPERPYTMWRRHMSIYTTIYIDMAFGHIGPEGEVLIDHTGQRNIARLRALGWPGPISWGSGHELVIFPCLTAEAPATLEWLQGVVARHYVSHLLLRDAA